MNSAEFDGFAEDYYQNHRANIAITGEGPEYFAEYKIAVLSQLISRMKYQTPRIFDFGSGIGNSIPHVSRLLPGCELTCADVSQRSLEISESRFPGQARILLIEGERIPASDNTYDVAFSACVFHHISHDEHVHWLSEVLRVTRPGGMIAVFEHNPLNPLTVRAVNTCPFDANARLIRAGKFVESYRKAGWREPRVRYHVFFPRALARLRPWEHRLSQVALGAQYSVVAMKPM